MPLPHVYEDTENTNDPPEPSVLRRASSYSDFYRIVQQELSKDGKEHRKKTDKWNRRWEALNLFDSSTGPESQNAGHLESYEEQLLDASQQEYLYAEACGIKREKANGDVDCIETSSPSPSDTWMG